MLQAHIDPLYVLDSMRFYEVKAILSNLYLVDKAQWESARMVAYIQASCFSDKQLKPTDITTFYWEKDNLAKESAALLEKENVERMRLKSQAMLNILNA